MSNSSFRVCFSTSAKPGAVQALKHSIRHYLRSIGASAEVQDWVDSDAFALAVFPRHLVITNNNQTLPVQAQNALSCRPEAATEVQTYEQAFEVLRYDLRLILRTGGDDLVVESKWLAESAGKATNIQLRLEDGHIRGMLSAELEGSEG